MSEAEEKGRDSLSRRRFLRALASTGLSSIIPLPRFFQSDVGKTAGTNALPSFEEVPSSRSGITWAHVAGFSPNMNEPETMGAGCAFVDYDNDGWMDIYLVNSGPCDFFSPKRPLRNALYHNNRDGSFTDVTEKGRRDGKRLRHGGGCRRLRRGWIS